MRSPQPPRSHPGGDDLLFAALVVVVVVAALLWGAGALSALVAGHPVPPSRPLAGLVALSPPAVEPSLAWGAPVSPTVLYWACTVFVLAPGGLLTLAGWRLW